jgi:mRNA interferase MazF
LKVQRGDVVLVNYPFANGNGSKVRPALVVQCDINNGRLDNTILAQIMSRIRLATTEPTQLLIVVDSLEGKQSGLLSDSAVTCENLYTVRQDIISRRIGSLPQEIMDRIDQCLIASLEIG